MSEDSALDRIEKGLLTVQKMLEFNMQLLNEAPAGITIQKTSKSVPGWWVVYVQGDLSGGINTQAQDPIEALQMFKEKYGHIYNWH